MSRVFEKHKMEGKTVWERCSPWVDFQVPFTFSKPPTWASTVFNQINKYKILSYTLTFKSQSHEYQGY